MKPLLLALAALASLGADWPRFRGPNGTGIADEPGVPVEFSLSKNMAWKIDLPGQGNGSPVVSHGRLFLQSADGDTRHLVCLDATTGKELWKRSREGKPFKTHRKGSLASSTPAADGERVVAVTWDGDKLHLEAFDFDGQPLWHNDLGAFLAEHGAGLSPVISGERVFLNNDQDEDVHLMAFDVKTGGKLWSAERKAFRACYSTPFLREPAGAAPELICTSTAAVTAYDPVTGKIIWEHPWDWSYTREPLRTVGSSLCVDGLVFAIAGNGAGNGHLLALTPGASAKPTVTWERKNKGWPYVPTMLGRDGCLFTVTDRGLAGCYDAKTGKEIWNERLGGGFSASPILVNGNVYAPGEDGSVYVFAAAKAFKLLARNMVGEPMIASPAAADGRLFLRGKSTLFCFGK